MTRGLTIIVTAAAALVLAGAAPAAAATPEYPTPSGRCVDTAGALQPGLCDRITPILTADSATYGDQIAVAVVHTTGDAGIDSWSTGLFNDWGVGEKGKDNGVLLVVAVDDHKLRITTGRGIGGRLSDDTASRIITDTITPRFKDNDYTGGVLDGLDQIRTALGHQVPAGTALAALASTAPETAAAGDASQGGQAQVVPAGAIPGAVPADGDGRSGAGYAVVAVLLVLAVVSVAVFLTVIVGIPLLVVRGSAGRRPGRGAGTGRPATPSARRRAARAGSSDAFWAAEGYQASHHHSHEQSSFGSFDGGSSFSGGGSSFGGGGSDGGGASGSW